MIIKYTASVPAQKKKWIQHTISEDDAILIGSTFTSKNILKYDTTRNEGCDILNEFLCSDSKEKAISFYEKHGNIFDFHKYLKFHPQLKNYFSLDGLYEQTCEELNIPPGLPDGKSGMTYEIFSHELFEYFRYDLLYINKLISVLKEETNITSADTMERIRENILSLYSSPNIDAFFGYLYNPYANDELSLTPFVSYPFYCYRFLDDSIFPDANLDKLISLCIPEIKRWIEQLTVLLNGPFPAEDYQFCLSIRKLAQKIINDFLSYYLDQNKSLPLYPLDDADAINDQYPSLIFALYDVVYHIGKKGQEVRYCADPYCGKLFIVPATSRKKYCCEECTHRAVNRKSERKSRSKSKKQATPEAASSANS